MKAATVALLIAALLAGVAIGHAVFRAGQTPVPAPVLNPVAVTTTPSEPEPSAAAPERDAPAGAEALRADNERLELENRALRASMVELRARLAALQEESSRRPTAARQPAAVASPIAPMDPAQPARRAPALDAAGGLAKAFATEHSLSQDQQARANLALRSAQQKLRALELENAEVKYASQDEVIVTVKPFAAAGEEVRAALQAEMDAILPQAAGEQVLGGAGSGVRPAFHNFGDGKRDITINIARSPESGKKSYTIRDSGSSGDASPVGSSMSLMVGGSSGGAVSVTSTSSDSSSSSGKGARIRSSYSRTLHVTELPEQYKHFLPE